MVRLCVDVNGVVIWLSVCGGGKVKGDVKEVGFLQVSFDCYLESVVFKCFCDLFSCPVALLRVAVLNNDESIISVKSKVRFLVFSGKLVQ